jgi:N-acetylmuramate 1-kinase
MVEPALHGSVGAAGAALPEPLLPALSENGLSQLADILALDIRAGDVLALEGDLGAGKTTFARALIRALSGGLITEVPSPTFTLVQSYDTGRIAVHHIDLYRLESPEAARELGLDELAAMGALLVEWPERAGNSLPANRLVIRIEDGENSELRRVTLVGQGAWRERALRIARVVRLLKSAGWQEDPVRPLSGDASRRSYARISSEGRSVLMMSSPPLPDRPAIRDGKPYWAIAHSARDVRGYLAVGRALARLGLSVPEVLVADAPNGLLLIEDLGDRLFTDVLAGEADPRPLYRSVTDVLLHLCNHPPPLHLPLPDGSNYDLPAFDLGALTIEIEQFLDWYWPFAFGEPASDATRRAFLSAWAKALAQVSDVLSSWVLRDVHAQNLFWLPERPGLRCVGIIDFQDALRGHAAYDLVSLLQDARRDVPEPLEEEMLTHYLAEAARLLDGFDRGQFLTAYAIFGAQRATKILGIFTRLSLRDGRNRYLAHLPRVWRSLQRNLRHPSLVEVESWLADNIPTEKRL